MAWLDECLEILFPPKCVACSGVVDRGAFFCEDCTDRVEGLPLLHCRRCSDPGQFDDGLCPRCIAFPPHFLEAHAPFVHSEAIARAIHRFKYEDHPELARPLAQLLAAEAEAFLRRSPGRLCPVPLHRKRFYERKYDQTRLLVGELCKVVSRGCLASVLVRERETKRQVGLSEREREENLAGAFCARAPLNGTVVLVDDVMTTGATVSSATRALLQAGASEVRVLALARASIGKG